MGRWISHADFVSKKKKEIKKEGDYLVRVKEKKTDKTYPVNLSKYRNTPPKAKYQILAFRWIPQLLSSHMTNYHLMSALEKMS